MKLKTPADLVVASEKLTPIQIHLLVEMADAMVGSCHQTINPASDILSPLFVDNFANRLLMHHATHYERFNKKAFEFAFQDSAIYAGRKSWIVTNSTNPGADLVIDGVSFSLKTEAAESIRTSHITISKLMEARWIRECANEVDFAREMTNRVTAHLEKYARIIMLRAFTISSTEVRYEMVEIPKDLLLRVRNLKAADFSPRTTSGGSGANVYVEISGRKTKAFSVKLDGSVEKVTISGLLASLCMTHGIWQVKTIPPS